MMEVTGTVTDVRKEQRRSGEGFNYLLFIGEAKYYLKEEDFDDALAYKDRVARVEYYDIKRGDKTYHNVQFFELASEGAIATAENGDRQERIEAQVAYKIIARLWCADKLANNTALVERLLEWLDKKICVQTEVETAPDSETKPDDVTEKQLALIRSELKKHVVSETEKRLGDRLENDYGVRVIGELNKSQASSFIKELQKKED